MVRLVYTGDRKLRLIRESKRRLPKNFREVEYIQSTGTQRIDTGVYAKSTLKTDIHFEVVDKTSGGHIFGGRTVTSGGRGYGVYLPTSGGIGFDYETRLTSNVSTTNGYKYRVVKDGASNTLYVNGVQSYTGNNTAATFDLNVKMALFYMKDSNTSFNASVKCKVFYFKIYDGGVIVRDFIPCLDASNVPCMYDLVEGKAYYNQGTGTFTVGRKIIPVDYLESTGTQCIDTGIKGKSGISAKTKVNYTYLSGSASHAIGGEYTSNTSCYFGMVRANGHFTYLYKTSVVETTTTLSTNTDYDIDITLNNGNQRFVINGNVVSTGTVSGDFTSTNNLFLYAINSVNGADVYGSLKMYYMQISDNGTLVRDFIPVKDENNVGYMFDKVTHSLYANAGSGAFVVGNEIKQDITRFVKDDVPNIYRKVSYLQSSGTQWIDTGVKYNSSNSYKIENKAYYGSRNGQNQLHGWNAGGVNGMAGTGLFSDGSNMFGPSCENKSVITEQIINSGTDTQTVTNYNIEGTTGSLSRAHTSLSNYAANGGYGIFACYSQTSFTYNASCKVYYYRIYQNGTLVRDFVPVVRKSDNKPGMYDRVSKQFFTNSGTGEFNFG